MVSVGAFLRGENGKLERITLHELRHTCASIFIAAGVNAKALSTYLGHASIQITLDRYGHLMPCNEDEAVALVDAYLEAGDWRTNWRAGRRNGSVEPNLACLKTGGALTGARGFESHPRRYLGRTTIAA